MELLTTDELAEILRLPRNRVILMARRGEIPALLLCGKLRFEANEVEAWLKQNRVKPGNPVRLES
jgi:excisionase family DNA binding protein